MYRLEGKSFTDIHIDMKCNAQIVHTEGWVYTCAHIHGIEVEQDAAQRHYCGIHRVTSPGWRLSCGTTHRNTPMQPPLQNIWRYTSVMQTIPIRCILQPWNPTALTIHETQWKPTCNCPTSKRNGWMDSCNTDSSPPSSYWILPQLVPKLLFPAHRRLKEKLSQ
jgi:hypothetical protein